MNCSRAGRNLVERQQLDAVGQEQALAAALGGEDAGQRTRLGRLVKADFRRPQPNKKTEII